MAGVGIDRLLNREFDAAICGSASRIVRAIISAIWGEGLDFSSSHDSETVGGNPTLHQIVSYRLRPSAGESQVERLGANRIGIAFNQDG